jgi:site-specific recombinase XerD
MCRFSVAARAMSATNAPDAASIMKSQADRATKNQDMMNKVKGRFIPARIASHVSAHLLRYFMASRPINSGALELCRS